MPLPKVEMTIFEAILARHSVRSYRAQQVDRAVISSLLEAAVHAPTAIHQEPWAFIVIQDRQLLQNLSDKAKPLFIAEAEARLSSSENSAKHSGHILDMYDSPDFNIFYDAGTLILICGKTTAPFITADCWLAAENLMLAACAMGLGSCVIGSALPAFKAPEARAKLRLPDEFSVLAPIILGYPENDDAPTLRKKPVILANFPAT